MVTQFNSVCLNRRRGDNKFLGCDTERRYERKLFSVQRKYFVIETNPFLKWTKMKQMLLCDLKKTFFSFLMCMQSFYTYLVLV